MQFHLHQNSTYVRHFLDENCVQIDIFRISPLKFRQTLANPKPPSDINILKAIKHMKAPFGNSHSQSAIHLMSNLSFQKIATTSQRFLQFILLCSCAILINTLINKWFILLTVPILVIYYIVQKFYRESTR